jgi:A/G-specific adenine glycosylase
MGLSLATQVVRWQLKYGRNDLPWQQSRDAYAVWLSEIMLQQTQVATVLDYFPRFLKRFPNLRALAAAQLDDVLALWSGLGYYSRARNLHACAQRVVREFGGEFPKEVERLMSLPGIGRSTAGAIAAISFGQRAPILDGNVKRVLTRVLGYGKDLAQSAHEKELWTLATDLLPVRDLDSAMPRYTQGMMDLGATVCLARKPLCESCPLGTTCVARAQGTPEKFPVKTKKLKRSSESLWLLWAQTKEGAVWLKARPTPGVWAGLYCMELFDSFESLQLALPARYRDAVQELPAIRHVLTHKDLFLHPVRVVLPKSALKRSGGAWYDAGDWPALGLPAPIRKLLVA